ncbi:MAG: hemolysin family protein [Actinomycetota bacterium]
MDRILTDVGLIVVLIAVNAFLAGSEVALVGLREGQLKRLSRQGRSGARFAALARDPSRFLATIQIGITLAGFLASATAAVSLAKVLVGPLGFLGELAEPVAILGLTAVLTFFTLVFGELAPKRIALQRAEGWGRAAARPLSFIAALCRPAVWLLGKATDVVVRLAGGDPSIRRAEIDKEELKELVSSQPGFHRVQRRVLSGAFEIAGRTLREVVVPRGQVLFLPASMESAEAVGQLAHSGHSRAPVRGDSIDQVLGVVHIRDLVGKSGPVGAHAREVLFLPETVTALAAIGSLQRERKKLAVVVDEHGGTEGIVTVEDLLEELVGDLYDEHDPDLRAVVHEPDGSFVVKGTFPVHDLPDLGVEVTPGSYTTVGGFVMDRLGRIPVRGDTVEEGRHRIEVLEVEKRAVKRVRIAKR